MEGILIFYFGLDYIKGLLLDMEGNEKITIVETIQLYKNGDFMEQDPEQWYQVVCKIICEIQRLDIGVGINYIAITYQPGTLVCIDLTGKPLINAILPCDERDRYQIRISEKLLKRYSEMHGIPWNYMMLPKILWIKLNKPDIYKRIFKILTPDGYLAYRLTGETSIDNYSACFLGYNANTPGYNTKILNNLELSDGMFPRVCKIGEYAGLIAGDIRGQLNLTNDVKVVIVSNLLTSLSMMTGLKGKNNVQFDLESSNICFNDSNSKIKSYKSFIKMTTKEGHVYGIKGNFEAQFIKWANEFSGLKSVDISDYAPGSNGLMVIPHIMGGGNFAHQDVRGSILGINGGSTKDILTAAYESIGYVLREKLDLISYSNVPFECVDVLCNLQDKLIYHIISDITGKKIIARDNYSEFTKVIYNIITGNKLLAEDEKEAIVPDEEKAYKYRHLYNLYRSACSSLNDVYRYRRKVLRKTMQ